MSIFNHFKQINLSQCQEIALNKIEAFLKSPVQVFMLKGYAGSGKTTLLKGLVEYLSANEIDFKLMAPTGRAAKVLSEKTKQEALTVHKSIYSFNDLLEVEDGDSFFYYYQIRDNSDLKNTVLIIDEASMLSDSKSEGEFFRFGSGHVLTDLIAFSGVSKPNKNIKIIFVGDPCQLPPVGDNSSKAFDSNFLKQKFNLSSQETEMKEVKRQSGECGILDTASKIRKSISAQYFNDFSLISNGKDIIIPTHENFMDSWLNAANPKIIIASKNKTCLNLNLQIRKRIFGIEGLSIQKNEIVIIGGNNYQKGVFNGEFAVISEVSQNVTERTISLKGKNPVTLIWREVEMVFPVSDGSSKIVKGKILENFLNGSNTLKQEETQALYVDFTLRHKELKPKTEEFKDAIVKDEYFNCLLVKYGYAVTCHKAQGGEWENVFTIWDHENLNGFNYYTEKQRKAGKTNQDFYRWAYTAITRASKTLFALNPPIFNSYSNMAFIDLNVLNTTNELSIKKDQFEEIILDEDLHKTLSNFKLLDHPIPLQDHFIKILRAIEKQNISILGWEKIGYEIRFKFVKENEIAVFKTHVNGKNEIKNSFTIIPNQSVNSANNNQIAEIINEIPEISVIRNINDTIQNKFNSEFDWEFEEKFPFTRNLYDDIKLSFKESEILIENIEHLSYKERYTFKRNSEKAVIDFEYNASGFWGRVFPIQNKTNSSLLISEIKKLLQNLKKEDYAF